MHYFSSSHTRTSHEHSPLQLSHKQSSPQIQVIQDLYLILNTILKRKLIRALEQIKIYNFNKSRKDFIVENMDRGLRIDGESDNQASFKTKKRSKSVDPYSEYSRAKLLQDIVAKLKAKNELSREITLEDNTSLDLRITNLQKIIQQTYYHGSQQKSQGSDFLQNTPDQKKIVELLNQIGRLKKEQNRKGDDAIRPMQIISNVSNLTPESNHSLYSDILPQLDHKKFSPIIEQQKNNPYLHTPPPQSKSKTNQHPQKNNPESSTSIKNTYIHNQYKTIPAKLPEKTTNPSIYGDKTQSIASKVGITRTPQNEIKKTYHTNGPTITFSHVPQKPQITIPPQKKEETLKFNTQKNRNSPLQRVERTKSIGQRPSGINFIQNSTPQQSQQIRKQIKQKITEYFPIEYEGNSTKKSHLKQDQGSQNGTSKVSKMRHSQKQSQQSILRTKSMSGISFGKINVLSPRPYQLKKQPINSRETLKEQERKKQNESPYFHTMT